MPYEITWTTKAGAEEREVLGTANSTFVRALKLFHDGCMPTVRDKVSGATYKGQAILDICRTVESGEMQEMRAKK